LPLGMSPFLFIAPGRYQKFEPKAASKTSTNSSYKAGARKGSATTNSNLTRQPLVKGATLVQTEVNAVTLLWCAWGWLSLSLLASFPFRGGPSLFQKIPL
jgi:hypothetical protein